MRSETISGQMGIQVIWDLFHFGYPDDIDLFDVSFIKRFAAYGREFMRVLISEIDSIPFVTPMNEIAFLACQGGEIGHINPFTHGRSNALKAQLVRATIESVEEIRQISPRHALSLRSRCSVRLPKTLIRSKWQRPGHTAMRATRHEGDMLAGDLPPPS